MEQLSPKEKILVNSWQRGFPLTSRPYKHIANNLGMTEQAVLEMLTCLKEKGVLGRVGAVVRPNTVGSSSLVAMSVPQNELEDIAKIVCREPCVNHNYERENALNLWFVVTASNAHELDHILARIAQKTGYHPLKLPLKKAYHIDLGFKL